MILSGHLVPRSDGETSVEPKLSITEYEDSATTLTISLFLPCLLKGQQTLS
jgi:hypothetical protein